MKSSRLFNKYYISSKIRFTIFISLILLILILSISAMFHTVYASGHGEVIKSYYIVTVEDGDTLWSIAGEHLDENNNGTKDIRRLIYEITELNELDSSHIVAGQKLLIPA